jgi:hypothetical protein
MKTLIEVKKHVADQKELWLNLTVLWSDFDDGFETGMKAHADEVRYNFLQENDVSDLVDKDYPDLIAYAQELRADALFNTLQALDLL